MTQPVFQKVAPVENFPEAEARIAAWWRERETFRRSLEKRAGGPRWTFYEGPPTANGLPHNGSVLTRVMKDVFPRYRSMRGYDVPRKAGWDTHGLPVEIEVEKELRISGKQAIVDYGVEPFVRRCIDSVFRYVGEWETLTEKLGFWIDTDDAYVTYHESYVESVWWALSELYKQGLLYQGHKVVWWWAQGGTALSAAEVGEGYKEVDDPSLYVRLPLADGSGRSLLAWTTTPWTLPGNCFAAVKPAFDYADVRDGDDVLVVAAALVPTLAEKVGRELTIERTYRGEELVGLAYEPPFDWFHGQAERPGGEGGYWRVVPADFVELTAGTGVVHVAPAYGEVDFELLAGERKARELPLVNAVLPDGSFDGEVAPSPYAGRWVKECDRDLIRELEARGLAWHTETYRHDYPFCWRAENDPLIQYARPAWYVRTTDRVEEALANNAAIGWLPEHIQEGRFGDFLRNNVDWALSRERFWGTPLNIWVNDETGAMDAPASVADILERNPDAFARFDASLAEDPTLSPHLRVHKPWIDYVTWQKPGEPGTYRRVPEVIDAWFDSGSMPFAQWGYPHRNREEFEAAFPADFICEAIDQTRGWFNSLLWISTLLFGESELPHPFRNCVVLGHVCDRAGRKESKSKGNYTPPEIILDRVRLEFAVADSGKDAPPAGRARIGREDYEGLDFTGEKTTVRIYRGDAEGSGVDLTLEPAKLPRRVIELSPADREALGVELAPHGLETRLGEVPSLPATQKLFVEDPGTPAPGADAFRWFFFAASPSWSNTRHSLGGVRSLQRDVPMKLRNVYAFLTIYANVDGFDPSDATCRAGRRPAGERALLDRWILSELALTNRRVIEHMDGYRLYEATTALSEFVDALSNWYVRRSRDRFWAPGLEPDKLDAHWTLYESVVTLAKLLAPFLPFATEDLWQNLVRGPFPESDDESVHLADFPEPDAAHIDEALSDAMGLVREIVSLGMQVRTAEKLRVRQPLEAAEVVLARPELAATIEPYLDLVRDELNVHAVHFVPKADEYVSYRVQPNFRALGPRVGKRMPALKKTLGEADGATLLAELEAEGHVSIEIDGERFELSPDEISVTLQAKEGFAAAAGPGGVVVLRTALTPELLDEGRFREVVNRVQNLRKELDLEYTARIELTLDGSATLLDAIRPRVDQLKADTLASAVAFDSPTESHDFEIDDEPLRVGLAVVPS
ncbi:MAG: isoleucine--tRNA ligase [Deltaproteobacteria bacterium]|nr:isoleucine--tRNA ligase [Deltaproteobacteria bacterium]MBW2446329.1 isoleucine--tRNA ligase [Deltaproteobacteria bacterium]